MTLPKGILRGIGLYRAETTASMQEIREDDGSGLKVGFHCLVDGGSLYVCTSVGSSGSIWSDIDTGGAGSADFDWTDQGNSLFTTSSLNVESSGWFSGVVTSSAGFSGSLTALTDGTPYIRGEGTVTVTTAANGSVIISGTGDGGSGGAGNTLNQAYDQGGAGLGRTITVDAGAMQLQGSLGSNVLEGTGTVDFSSGEVKSAFTGSLTQLLDGTPFIRGTGTVFVTTASNGSIIISGSDISGIGGVTLDGAYDFGGSGIGRTITVDAGSVRLQGSLGANVLEGTGTVDFINGTVLSSFTGSLTQLIDGSPYIRGTGAVTVTTASNGSLIISSSGGSSGGGGVTLDGAYDFGGAGVGRAIAVDTGAVQLQGTLGQRVFEATGSVDITGSLSVDEITGSIHRTLDGLSYLVGQGLISVTSQSNGQVILSSSQGGGSLNYAYDFGGDGLGRSVTVDAEAIQLLGTLGANVLEGTGTVDFTEGVVKSAFTGSLTQLSDGSPFIRGTGTVFVTTASNGSIIISGSGASGGGGGGGGSLNDAYDFGGPGAGRAITVDTGAIQFQGTVGQNVFEVTGTVAVTGTLRVDNGALSGGSISGSIHHTSDGLSFLVAGTNTTILSAANGQLTIASSDTNTQNTLDEAYDEGGAGAGRLVNVDTGAVQFAGSIGSNAFEVTGTVDVTGSLTVDNGAEVGGSISGSIHETADGLSYLIGVGSVTITSQSNGQLIISGSGVGDFTGNTLDQAYDEGGAGAGRAINVDTGPVQFLGSIGSNTLEVTGTVDVTGSLTVDNGEEAGASISGSIHHTSDGLSFLVAGSNVTIVSASNGQVTFTSSDTNTQNTLDEAYDEGGAGVGRAINVDTGAVQLLGSIGSNSLEVTGTIDVTGSLTVDNGTETGASISGSIHHTADGLSYLVGEGSVFITSQSNGQIVISGSGGGGGGSGNTLDQAYDEGGAGAGRAIVADTGAVQVQGTVGTNAFEVTGTVDISGHLAATTKSFVIKHPSEDKEGMFLRHGSLEGPEHAVYVRGKCLGSTIELPDYWKDLIDEKTITVQLQPIDHAQDLIVVSWNSKEVEVKDVIQKGNEHPYFFYTVHAERKDVDKLEVES